VENRNKRARYFRPHYLVVMRGRVETSKTLAAGCWRASGPGMGSIHCPQPATEGTYQELALASSRGRLSKVLMRRDTCGN
jgi:hypothetical protein